MKFLLKIITLFLIMNLAKSDIIFKDGIEDVLLFSPKNSGTTYGLRDITYGNSKYVIATADLATLDGGIIFSNNGVDWFSSNTLPNPSGSSKWRLYGVAFGNNNFIAVGRKGRIIHSNDAIQWTDKSVSSFFVNNGFSEYDLYGVAYGQGKFIAVGGGYVGGSNWTAVVFTSTNGLVWDGQVLSSFFDLSDIKFINNKFIATGAQGQIISTTNGVDWEDNSSGINTNLGEIAFGNGLYLVGGEAPSSLLTSNDGVIWSDTGYTGKDIEDVEFANGIYVAVGYSWVGDSPILYSTNGIDWIESSSNTTDELYKAFYANNILFILGERGKILTSKVINN